ncbi:MAG: hypothetical protein LBR77_01035 [Lachnospiraceae bacterium]|jgi:hypothetical protein|nr:hypothetical protein [Lachnospiraceae bacterium]
MEYIDNVAKMMAGSLESWSWLFPGHSEYRFLTKTGVEPRTAIAINENMFMVSLDMPPLGVYTDFRQVDSLSETGALPV